MDTHRLRILAAQSNDGVLRGPAMQAADALDAYRKHAEELAGFLREALDELDEYYRAEYDTDHPYHKDKLACARASWGHARALLARIERQTT